LFYARRGSGGVDAHGGGIHEIQHQNSHQISID